MVQQNAQRKNILPDGGFQRGNGRGRRRHLRVGIGLVQRADEPGRPFLARHVRRMHFGLQIGLGNGDLFLRAAHLNVIQRHFRHQRHLRAVYIFAGGLDGGVVGLKLPPRDAKKIQIPHRRRPCAEGVAGTAAVYLVDRASAGERSRSRQGRPQSARILAAGGARLAQQRRGQLHVQIGSERRIDQPGQLGVLEIGPPKGQVNRVVRQARARGRAAVGHPGPGWRRLGFRGLVIRANHAAADHVQREQGNGQGRPRHWKSLVH